LRFEERLGVWVEREMTERFDRRLKNRLLQAKLKPTAGLEDPDYPTNRGPDKAVLHSLQDGQGLKKRSTS
jgi:hypothetical protein